MNNQSKKAILLVSFGTGNADTRRRTLDAIETDVRTAFPSYQVYTAWTSSALIERRKKEDGVTVDTVAESLHRMKNDGITDVVVQHTFVIRGVEYEIMKAEASACRGDFSSFLLGEPLLSTGEDLHAAAKVLAAEFSDLAEDTVLIFMGHGAAHQLPVPADNVYSQLNHTFHAIGHSNIFVGAMHGTPSLEELLPELGSLKPSEVILLPLLITAGGHALKELNGDSPESWKNRLLRAGFPVKCILKGLGEYSSVRTLCINHISAALTDKSRP